MREHPDRCCFCIPLIRGLVNWGYAKLVIHILTIAYIILTSCLVQYIVRDVRDAIILSVIGVLLLIDALFNIHLARHIRNCDGGHRKRVKLLNILYIYNIASLVFLILAHSFKIYLHFRYLLFLWKLFSVLYTEELYILDWAIGSGLTFCIIIVQIYYITLLIRNEMIKQRHQRLGMQLSSHLASDESVTDQCTGKNAEVV